MSGSDESNDSCSEVEHEFHDEFLLENGSNAFAFEPEYPENEVEERLRAYMFEKEKEMDENVHFTITESTDPTELDDEWCKCEKCVHMDNVTERVCCQSSSEIINDKFANKKCITLTDAFRDVCLNRNVLQWLMAPAHGGTDRNK